MTTSFRELLARAPFGLPVSTDPLAPVASAPRDRTTPRVAAAP
jgi:hypothetical protein